MTHWIITRHGQPTYRTASYPRFLIEWGKVEHLPDADWTTSYERKSQ